MVTIIWSQIVPFTITILVEDILHSESACRKFFEIFRTVYLIRISLQFFFARMDPVLKQVFRVNAGQRLGRA